MKLKAGIFLALFVLAAGFGLAAGAALSSEADKAHFEGELLSGSREAAGFKLTLDAAFEEHLVLSETYDASSGKGSSRGARRSPEPLRLHEDSAEPALEYPSIRLSLIYYRALGEPLPGELPAALADEVEALIAEGGGERRLSLSDFTDRAPLCFQTRNIAREPDSAAAYGLASGGERFALPAPEDAELELSLHVNTKSYSLFVSVEGPAVDAVSNSVYTGGGLYLLLADAAFFTGGAGPVSAALASAACEDGLLYTLEHIYRPKGSPEGGFAYAHRLAAFDAEGNCLYCEQLSHPLTDYFNRPPSSGAGEFRLTGPERS